MGTVTPCQIAAIMNKFGTLLLAAAVASTAVLVSATLSDEAPTKRSLPIFSIVKFPNDLCTADNRNGTCYTAEECSNKGGNSTGSCADGYGVCCAFELGCGGVIAENNTYMINTGATTQTGACTYEICPCNTDICRIRFDFKAFTLDSQQTATAEATPTAENVVTLSVTASNFAAIGSCGRDTFSLTGAPTICGVNTGHHMIVDTNGIECKKASFNLGAGDTTTSRTWHIQVQQYECGDEMGGPPGCLQYFTASTGNVNDYGKPAAVTAYAQTTTHLQNQDYSMCFRRNSGNCAICFTPSLQAAVITATYGLGVSANLAIAQSAVGSVCNADYLTIPYGETIAEVVKAVTADTDIANAQNNAYCGRLLNSNSGTAAIVSICTKSLPFMVRLYTDDNELASNAAVALSISAAILTETNEEPGGIYGFQLNFKQQTCP